MLRQHTGRGARQHKTEANFSSCSVATGSSSKTLAQGSDQVSTTPRQSHRALGRSPVQVAKFKPERSGFRSARYAIGISDSAE